MLNTKDTKRIETALKSQLPAQYKISLSVAVDECIDERTLLRTPKDLISINRSCRKLHVNESPWPKKYFVIGEDGCGNYYILDSRMPDGPVLMYDHEVDDFVEYASSLAKFISGLVKYTQRAKRAEDAFSVPKHNLEIDPTTRAAELMCAIQRNKKAELKRLLREGANPNTVLNERLGCSPPMTILVLAVQLNRIEMVELLLSAGASATKSGSKHRASPLHHAVKSCGTAGIEKLLKYGADPNRRFRGRSAMHLAINLSTSRTWNFLFKWLQKRGLKLAPVSRKVLYGLE